MAVAFGIGRPLTVGHTAAPTDSLCRIRTPDVAPESAEEAYPPEPAEARQVGVSSAQIAPHLSLTPSCQLHLTFG